MQLFCFFVAKQFDFGSKVPEGPPKTHVNRSTHTSTHTRTHTPHTHTHTHSQSFDVKISLPRPENHQDSSFISKLTSLINFVNFSQKSPLPFGESQIEQKMDRKNISHFNVTPIPRYRTTPFIWRPQLFRGYILRT